MPILRRLWVLWALLPCAQAQTQTPAHTQPPATPPLSANQPHLVLSDDGALVIDTKARLAWSRCVEGMVWTGRTCTGVPHLMTHAQAQALAVRRWKEDNVRWRLPRVPEFRRLIDKNAKPVGLNPKLFPNDPADLHWTGTANVNASAVNPYAYGNVTRGGVGESALSIVKGWAVDTSTGNGVPDVGRGVSLLVRLVRPAPTAAPVPALPASAPKSKKEEEDEAEEEEEEEEEEE